ncbi:MAG: hypothetical protein A2033_05230 [Bacteroidetes bacterium GWA2_31_9]|nr:MAG: hypothetical protein A2033_05230 [Bacteroidetes bacterium GWA2_31_9]
MKKILILIVIIECFCFDSFSQVVHIINGKESAWQNIEIISENTSFIINGDGIVNFGCSGNSCVDDITAGVEGNSWWSWWQKRGYYDVINLAFFTIIIVHGFSFLIMCIPVIAIDVIMIRVVCG